MKQKRLPSKIFQFVIFKNDEMVRSVHDGIYRPNYDRQTVKVSFLLIEYVKGIVMLGGIYIDTNC
jgi:hypothetical protein